VQYSEIVEGPVANAIPLFDVSHVSAILDLYFIIDTRLKQVTALLVSHMANRNIRQISALRSPVYHVVFLK